MGSAKGLQGRMELCGHLGLGECGKESSTGLSLGIWTNLCEAPRTGMAGEKSWKDRGKHAKPRKVGTGGLQTRAGSVTEEAQR